MASISGIARTGLFSWWSIRLLQVKATGAADKFLVPLGHEECMSPDESSPTMDRLEQYAVELGVVIRLDPEEAGLMILIKNEADPTFDRMIAQYIEHVMGLRLIENTAASRAGWRQLGVILHGPTTTHQQVFGELTWRPESAQLNVPW